MDMNTEIIKVYYGYDIFESTSREMVIKWVDEYIDDYNEEEREYLDLYCGPLICTCLESTKNFYCAAVKSVLDSIDNNSVVGYYKGSNIRRNNIIGNSIYISFKEEIIMSVNFSKMTLDEYRYHNISK